MVQTMFPTMLLGPTLTITMIQHVFVIVRFVFLFPNCNLIKALPKLVRLSYSATLLSMLNLYSHGQSFECWPLVLDPASTWQGSPPIQECLLSIEVVSWLRLHC